MAVTRIVNAEMKSKVNDTDYEILHPITTTKTLGIHALLLPGLLNVMMAISIFVQLQE